MAWWGSVQWGPYCTSLCRVCAGVNGMVGLCILGTLLHLPVSCVPGVNGMVGLCILGTNVRHSDPATGSSLSIAWMVSLLASLLAFFAAINVFQVPFISGCPDLRALENP